MNKQLFEIVLLIQMSLAGLGFLLTLIQFRKREQYVKFLSLALLLSFLGDEIGNLLYENKINPNYGMSGYYILILPVYTAIYYNATGRKFGKILLIVVCIYLIFAVSNLLFIQKDAINSYSLMLLSAVIIFYSVFYFFWLIRELPTTEIHLLPMFWINTGMIIYFSGNLVLFIFTSYLVNVLNNNLLAFWSFHNVLGSVQGLLFIIATLVDTKNINKKRTMASIEGSI